MKKLILGMLWSLSALTLGAQVMGRIEFLDGPVSVNREGEDLKAVDMGLKLEAYDTITTGDGGIIEISLDPATGFGGAIKMNQKTIFTLETRTITGIQQNQLGLLAGSVTLKLKAIAGKTSSFQVNTANTALGVRGTEFSVTTANQTDVLLTTAEGDVEVTTEDGKVLHGRGGEAVEINEGEAPQNLKILDPESHRKSWEDRRRQFFKKNLKSILPRLIEKLDDLSDKVLGEEKILLKECATFISNMRKNAQGKRFLPGQRLERLRLKAALVRLRVLIPQWENLSYRLENLRENIGEGDGKLDLGKRGPLGDFLKTWDKRKTEIRKKALQIRGIFKLYQNASTDNLPPELEKD